MAGLMLRVIRGSAVFRRTLPGVGNDLRFGGESRAGTLVQHRLDSLGHRKNLLDGRMVEIGVGVAAPRGGGVYATQTFGDC